MLIICSHTHQGNPFWKLVRDMLKTPSREQIDCQHPKPILLDTGEMKKPYDWAVGYSHILNGMILQSLRSVQLSFLCWSNRDSLQHSTNITLSHLGLVFYSGIDFFWKSNLNCNHPQVDSLGLEGDCWKTTLIAVTLSLP